MVAMYSKGGSEEDFCCLWGPFLWLPKLQSVVKCTGLPLGAGGWMVWGNEAAVLRSSWWAATGLGERDRGQGC